MYNHRQIFFVSLEFDFFEFSSSLQLEYGRKSRLAWSWLGYG